MSILDREWSAHRQALWEQILVAMMQRPVATVFALAEADGVLLEWEKRFPGPGSVPE